MELKVTSNFHTQWLFASSLFPGVIFRFMAFAVCLFLSFLRLPTSEESLNAPVCSTSRKCSFWQYSVFHLGCRKNWKKMQRQCLFDYKYSGQDQYNSNQIIDSNERVYHIYFFNNIFHSLRMNVCRPCSFTSKPAIPFPKLCRFISL